MGRHVALLRAVNVGGRRKVPMAELRAVAEGLGLRRVRTFIASGNLLFDAEEPAEALEARLEEALERRFGFAVETLVRSAGQWSDYVACNPLPEEAARAPKLLMLYLGKQAATEEAVEALRARAAPGERVEHRGNAVWIFFAHGGRSKLDGGPRPGVWTGRNWRTVLAIEEMLSGPGASDA